jgi:hypothetical protein
VVNTFILVKGFTHRNKLLTLLSELFEIGVLFSALFTSLISNIARKHSSASTASPSRMRPLVLAIYHFRDGGSHELLCSTPRLFSTG